MRRLLHKSSLRNKVSAESFAVGELTYCRDKVSAESFVNCKTDILTREDFYRSYKENRSFL